MELVKELHHRLSEPLFGGQNALEVTTMTTSFSHSEKDVWVLHALVVAYRLRSNDGIILCHHDECWHTNVRNLVITRCSILIIIFINVAKYFGSNLVIPIYYVVHILISSFDI